MTAELALVVPVAIAIAVSLVLTPLAGRLAWKCNAVAYPDGDRRLHARPTPLWGGGAVCLALFLALAGSGAIMPGAVGWLSLSTTFALSAGILCLLGCCDDLYDINARQKLLGQIVATLPVVLAGHYADRLCLFGWHMELGWPGVFWTMGWLVLGINALNLIDGMDGLASLIGIVSSVAIAAIAGSYGHAEVMLLALVLAGSLAGFLIYNLPPARIYLGDCGSMLIGFAVALLAMHASTVAPMPANTSTPITANVTIVVILLLIPLTDTALAIVRRTLSGRSFMAADRDHVHHRLLDRGFSIWRVLALLGTCCLITGAIAWWVAGSGQRPTVTPELWAWAVVSAGGIFLVNRRLVGHREWELARRILVETAQSLVRRQSGQASPSRFRDGDATTAIGPYISPTNGETAAAGDPIVELADGSPLHGIEVLPDDAKKAA